MASQVAAVFEGGARVYGSGEEGDEGVVPGPICVTLDSVTGLIRVGEDLVPG